MIKLTNVRWIHSRNLTEKDREELLISKNYNGKIALETWNINNKEIKRKAIPVLDAVNYIRGLGDFKEDFVKSKDEVKKDE